MVTVQENGIGDSDLQESLASELQAADLEGTQAEDNGESASTGQFMAESSDVNSDERIEQLEHDQATDEQEKTTNESPQSRETS